MMHVKVILEFTDMTCGVKHEKSIVKSILGNISVSMTWCETKPGGGYRKGVRVIAYGRNVESVIETLGLSGTGSWG